MLCKVYIHDLDVKVELNVRHTLLMSGARFATNIRFVNDLNDADLWIMREDSALLNYAKKRAATHYLSLWVCDASGQLFDLKNTQDALSTRKISQIIDVIVLQLHKKSADREATVDAKNSKLIQYLRYGFEQKRGKLFLQYREVQLLVDFSDMVVRYNEACHKLLWQNNNAAVDFTAFEIIAAPTENPVFEHSCSAFAIAWRIMHNAKEDRLIIPLSSHSVLKLNEWPSFEHENHDFEDYRIASFLQKRPFSAKQIIDLLKIPEEQVYSFFNTVYITGIASIRQEEPAAVVAKQPEKTSNSLMSLWRKVRTSLWASRNLA